MYNSSMKTSHDVYYGLPDEVRFCKLCVISNQRPSSTIEFRNSSNQKKTISIDENGICDACKYNEIKNNTDWDLRNSRFLDLLERYRRNDGRYDCIVPSSGGKDSSFTAHKLKYKYGMNPLTVTWAPAMFTDIGRKNLENLGSIGGIDNILYTPNAQIHSMLTRNAFLNLGHPFQPFIHGQKIIGPRIAAQMDIPLVVYGENQAEYGNSIEENNDFEMNQEFFTFEEPTDLLLGGISVKEYISEFGYKISDFSAYFPITKAQSAEAKTRMVYLGYFEKWDPQECYYYASEKTGFSAAPERSDGTYSKYTEIDDKIVPFHFYTTYIKFGIGRATYDACQEIRNEKITRDEGVALVRKFDGEFPHTYLDDFLQYVGISEENFLHQIDTLRSPHLWKRTANDWELKHKVWE